LILRGTQAFKNSPVDYFSKGACLLEEGELVRGRMNLSKHNGDKERGI